MRELRPFKILALSLIFLYQARGLANLPAPAGYPAPASNHDVCEELTEDTDRKIYRNNWFCAGLDGQVFLRALGKEEFYHGFSYWMQGRTELKPNDFLTINIRTVLYSGSVSYSYVLPTHFFNVVGFTGIWPEPVLGGQLKGRIMDLERQTIGAGLFLQDFDSAGMRFDWEAKPFRVRFMGEGTGVLLLQEDTINFDLSWRDDWLGAGIVWWTEKGDEVSRFNLYYLYSIIDWPNDFRSKLEINVRNQKYAGLAALEHRWLSTPWLIQTGLQFRSYQDGIGQGFVGQIHHLYTSYEQLNKSYVNTKNIFTTDDDVLVYAGNLELAYAISDKWQIFGLVETGSFNFQNANHDKFSFYRYGMAYFPVPDRRESLTLFFSNKVLRDSFARPPSGISTINAPLFKAFEYFGLEANFSI